jgi:adenylate cyclase
MKKIIILFGFLVCINAIFSQSENIDTMLQKIASEKDDNTRIDLINDYISITSESDPLKDMQINHMFLSQARKINDKITEAMALSGIGYDYMSLGNTPKSVEYNLKANALALETENEKLIANTEINLALIYKVQADYPKAFRLFLSAAESGSKINDFVLQIWANGNLSEICLEMNKIDSALMYAQRDFELCTRSHYYDNLDFTLQDLGSIQSKMGNSSLAINYFDLAIQEALKTKLPKRLNMAYTAKAQYFYNINQNDSSAGYAKKAIAVVQHTAFSNYSIKPSKLLLDIYRNSNIDSAFKYSEMHRIANDSMFSAKTMQQTQLMTFENELRQQEIKEEKALYEARRRNFLFTTVLGLFLLIGLMLYRNIRQHQKVNKVLAEKNEIITESMKRSDDLLLNILPYEVAEELKQTGHCQAKTFSMVTVMFADFKDFTRVSEKVSAELLVNEINYCFSAFDLILPKYKVEKIKTVGDAYICVGGMPTLNFTHPSDVINVAIEIRNLMLERKKEKEAKGEIPFELRIGIHTGPVVAGIVGVKKYAYDIWGDTVNLAARMESSCEAGKINISGVTHALVKDKFNCTYRGKIVAKNKGELDMYFVESILG